MCEVVGVATLDFDAREAVEPDIVERVEPPVEPDLALAGHAPIGVCKVDNVQFRCRLVDVVPPVHVVEVRFRTSSNTPAQASKSSTKAIACAGVCPRSQFAQRERFYQRLNTLRERIEGLVQRLDAAAPRVGL